MVLTEGRKEHGLCWRYTHHCSKDDFEAIGTYEFADSIMIKLTTDPGETCGGLIFRRETNISDTIDPMTNSRIIVAYC